MAQRKKKQSEDSRLTNKFSGNWSFVQHTMTSEERKAFESVEEDSVDTWGLIDQLAESNYKLSVSWDDYNHCLTASLACRDEKSDNYQLILTARHSNAEMAVRLLLFKHFVLLNGEWLQWHTADNREKGEWG